ncbi:hypothetical protein [Roseiconus lacunae]|uniref:hypothetical protein n=1 Tax=Roseiconus lacunae TaxID=2605694 RepID=UPI0011F13AA9|nr:hypothetical protein [Roseiconus lacunae]
MSDATRQSSDAPSLGGASDAIPYPSLALDPEGEGVFGNIERWCDRCVSKLNPILIKEARQSLKSRQFLITFFCLLVASCAWTVIGVVSYAPDIYFLPSGQDLMSGYFIILSVSMLAFVPLVAFRSLAAELDEGTYEMLAITRLSAWRIVSGKMNSACLQMLIYFSAIVPCLAFCYLLRGVGLLTILLTVVLVLVTSLVLTSFALVLSTVAKGRTLQTFLLVGLVALVVFAEFTLSAFVLSEVLGERWSGTFLGYALPITMALSFVGLFLAAAAARIAPVTENRSTRLRAIMLGQQILWIVTIVYATWATKEIEFINLGMIMITVYWFFTGTLICGESRELSPRVLREWPSTYATKMLLSWWMPGPGTGLMFCISTALAGMIVMAGMGMFGWMAGTDIVRHNGSPPLFLVALNAGYLFGYLGCVRLLSMPLLKRFGPSFITPMIVALVLLFLGILVPCIFDVIFTGRVSSNYSVMHASNWFWTWGESFRRRGIQPVDVTFLILFCGLGIMALNLILLFREFQVERIAVPARVEQDQQNDRSPSDSAPIEQP